MTIFEGMTSIASLINAVRDGLTDRKIKEIWFAVEKNEKKFKEKNFLTAVSHTMGFLFKEVRLSDLEPYVTGTSHGGIIAFCEDRIIPTLTDANQLPKNGFLAILEGMEDPYNFGNSVRSLYAAGANGLILPFRNWMEAAGTVARASAGTSELLPMWCAESADACKICKQAGYRIICAGIRDSVSIDEADLHLPLLLVIGGEKRGISRTVLNYADQVVRIDYGRSFRGSLSASATAAVLGFNVLKSNKK